MCKAGWCFHPLYFLHGIMTSKNLIEVARSTVLLVIDMCVSMYKVHATPIKTTVPSPCGAALQGSFGHGSCRPPFLCLCCVPLQVLDKRLSLWCDLQGNNQRISLVPFGLGFLLIVSVYLTAEISHQIVLTGPAAVSSVSALSLSRDCFPGSSPPAVCLL